MRVALFDCYSHPTKRFYNGMSRAREQLAAATGWETVAYGTQHEDSQLVDHYIEDLEQLRDYDAVVLNAPGTITPTLGLLKLHDLGIKYFVQSHSEADEWKLPHAHEVVSRSRGFLPIAANLWKKAPRVSTHVYASGKDVLVPRVTRRKCNVVVSAGRVTEVKRIAELLCMRKSIEQQGFELEVHGLIANAVYAHKCTRDFGMGQVYKGPYGSPDTFSYAKYVWAVSAWAGAQFVPRVELTVSEGLENGLMPIYDVNCVPQLFDGHAVTLQSLDSSALDGLLRSNIADKVAVLRDLYNDAYHDKTAKLLNYVESHT